MQCLICQKSFTSINGLSNHLRIHNIHKYKDYYDIYLKTNLDSICVMCTKPTKFRRGKYNTYCSKSCINHDPEIINKMKHTYHKTCMSKYSMPYVTQTKFVRDLIIKNNKNNDPSKIAATKYTSIKKYGVDCSLKNKDVQRTSQETCFKHYGVYFPAQNSRIHRDQQRSAFKLKEYILPSGKIIFKQGYEPQFLDYVFKNNILTEDEIIYTPTTITYTNIKNKISHYHPDFYIPKYNLIVEIKSNWTYKKDKNVLLKEQACKNNGYSYVRIIDNNFSIFLDTIIIK